jgi:hypothetical protein
VVRERSRARPTSLGSNQRRSSYLQGAPGGEPIPIFLLTEAGRGADETSRSQGGHFAALEKPAVLLADIEEFLAQEWVE